MSAPRLKVGDCVRMVHGGQHLLVGEMPRGVGFVIETDHTCRNGLEYLVNFPLWGRPGPVHDQGNSSWWCTRGMLELVED